MEVPGRDQLWFQARCTEDFVPESALVRAIDEIMDRLDYSVFEQRYPGGGRPAWRPKLLAKILLFAYSQGIRSAREVSRLLERDLHLMWLAHEQRIGHHRPLAEAEAVDVAEDAELGEARRRCTVAARRWSRLSGCSSRSWGCGSSCCAGCRERGWS